MAQFSPSWQLDYDIFMSRSSYRHVVVVHPLQFWPMQMRDYKRRRFVIRRSDIRLFYCPGAAAGTEGFASVAIFWLLPLPLPPLLPAVLFDFEVRDLKTTALSCKRKFCLSFTDTKTTSRPTLLSLVQFKFKQMRLHSTVKSCNDLSSYQDDFRQQQCFLSVKDYLLFRRLLRTAPFGRSCIHLGGIVFACLI